MSSPNQPADTPQNKAAEHIADAHHLLEALQRKLGQHPELDEAIVKLELALSALTLQTGGLL
jgi:Lon protease-like protein